MTNKRDNPTRNQRTILYNEVDGLCPICSNVLGYEKKGRNYFKFEAAHIYPLNPSQEELLLLKDVPRLSLDVNSLENFIALCKDCHLVYDNPKDLDSYMTLYNRKKVLLDEAKVNRSFYKYDIEDEIRNVIEALANVSDIDLVPLDYSALKVEKKIKEGFNIIVKRRIHDDVVDYYAFIKRRFQQVDSSAVGKFNLIACQIKIFYQKMLLEISDQELIYNKIAEWIYKKVNLEGSIDSCKVIVAFFIQNCEVFEDVSKQSN